VLGILAAALVAVNACASVQRIGPATQERAWRTYLGSEQRAPAALDSVNIDPQPVWRTDVGRGVAGAPALTEDLVAVAQVDRQVALLDRSTGDAIWRHRLANPPGAGPLVDGDRVYVATQEDRGRVYALQLATGGGVWSAGVGDVAAPLAMDDSTLYAATTTGLVAALGTASGARRWRAQLPGAVRAAPLPTPAGIVVATTSDSIFLLARGTGAVRVRRALRGSVLGAPALADSLVLVGTSAGELVALGLDSLAPLWRVDLGGGVVGCVAVRQRTAYALTGRGRLWRVPLDDPASATHVETGIIARAGPAPTASGVFLAGVNGELTLIDPATGQRRWSVRLQAPLEQPVVVDGHFFIAVSARGDVVAFR
jgi:outer membrane protein assembly factor BamB